MLLAMAILFTGQVVIPVHADQPPASIRLNPLEKNPESLETRYVFDVVMHHPEEMSQLLQRVEQLAETIEPGDTDPQLALVLHGPEIAFFNTQNYDRFADLVDRAAALDKKGIIDVKVCETMLRSLDIDADKLPDFVDRVPFGPAEIDKLVERGYVRM
jgi:intracellular sulfur oxidation DsrE/DsrF family protein